MERPILFSTPMVQAILDGRKTQTRRIVKPPFSEWITDENIHSEWARGLDRQCKFGQRGDILWVRETFTELQGSPNDQDKTTDTGEYFYKADFIHEGQDYSDWKWKPSIFMPKEACRIRLEITNIRVERLQDISEEDAKAEGIKEFTKDGVGFKYGLDGWHWSYLNGSPYMGTNNKTAYEILWESINGKDSWEKNPWVWVIEFKRIIQ